MCFFFFNDTATTEIYTLSLHDALPISQGIADVNNSPGARSFGSASWVDSAGMLWLFGGNGYDAIGTNGKLNDLWKYDIRSEEHTSELQSLTNLVCRLLLEKKKTKKIQ